MENMQLVLDSSIVDNKVLKALEKDLERIGKLIKRKWFRSLNSRNILEYSLLTPATLQAISQKYNLQIIQSKYSIVWSATMYIKNFRIEFSTAKINLKVEVKADRLDWTYDF